MRKVWRDLPFYQHHCLWNPNDIDQDSKVFLFLFLSIIFLVLFCFSFLPLLFSVITNGSYGTYGKEVLRRQT